VALGLVERFVGAARTDVRVLGPAERDVSDHLHGHAVIDAQNDLAHMILR
jgi:hypothetical protein